MYRILRTTITSIAAASALHTAAFAIPTFQLSLEQDPEPTSKYTAGIPWQDLRGMIEGRQYRDGVERLKKIKTNKDNIYSWRIWMGIFKARLNEDDQSFALLDQCLPLHDVSLNTRTFVAKIYHLGGFSKKTIEILEKIPPQNPSADFAYETRGTAFASIGNDEAAAADWLKQSKQDFSGYVHARTMLAELRYRQNRMEEALKFYDEILGLTKNRYPANLGKAKCFLKMKQYQKAADEFTLVINHVDDATKNKEKDLKFGQTLGLLYRDRADCYDKLGKTGLAAADRVKYNQLVKNLDDEVFGKK